MMNSRFILLPLALLGIFSTSACYAASVGDVATGLMDSFTGAAKIVQVVCIIVGVGLITNGLIRLKSYYDNPHEVRLSGIIFMVIVGLLLIGLSFIPMPMPK